MNSANITGFSARGDLGVAPQRTVAKGDEGKKPSVDFRQLMQRSVAKGGQAVNVDRGNAYSVKDMSVERKEISSLESPKQEKINNDNKDSKAQTPTDMNGTKEKVDAVGKDVEAAVKEEVTEELGITDEQLEEAMEVLGLSYVDLLDPANMQMLLQQVSEDVPDLAMDVLSLSPTEMVGNLEDAAANVLAGSDLAPEEMGALLSEMVPVDEPVVMESFSNILEKAGIPTDMLEAMSIRQDANVVAPRMEREDMPNVSIIEVVDDEPETIVVSVTRQPESMTEAAAEAAAGDETVGLKLMEDMVADEVAASSLEDDADVLPLDESVEVDATMTMVTSLEGEASDEDFGGNLGGNMADDASAMTFEGDDGLAQTLGNTAAQTLQSNFNEAIAAARQVADTAATYASIDTANIMEQIATNAQTTINNEVTRMEMELNPQSLGRMIMQVESNADGVVTAKLIAQNEAVREALETQMNVLRENLNNRGVRVEAVEVTVGTHEFEQNLEENARGEGAYEGQDEKNGRQNQGRRMRNLNLNDLDGMQGLMTEEEELAARMMRDEGNVLNYQA